MKLNPWSFLFLLLLLLSCDSGEVDRLAAEFRDPPSYTRPWVYWYWIDENISREGITRDLESMARVGIGQALIGHISPGSERGATRILSEKWWKMVEHAVSEGQRLGVDIGFFNGPGWSQSGGPWITPDQAMRYVVSNEVKVNGPSHFSGTIPSPADTLFQDISLLAFKVSGQPGSTATHPPARINSYPATPGAVHLFDRKPLTHFIFPSGLAKDKHQLIDIHFTEPQIIHSIEFDFLPIPFKVDVEIQAAGRNKNFRSIRKFTLDRRNINFEIGPMRFEPATFSLPGIDEKTSHYRLIFSNLTKNGEAGIKEIRFSNTARLDQVIEKQLGKMYSDPLPPWDAYLWPYETEPSDDMVIEPDQIIDISSQMDAEGHLEWDVPAGNWVILRSGMVPTGATNVPVPPEATGFECDKLTSEAVETHFNSYLGKFLQRVPADERQSFKTVVIDSYEVGPQNWTGDFRKIFQQEFGYDPIPWLPVLTGRIVGSTDQSNRFLWDVRRLSADRIANAYVKRLRELSNEQGLDLWVENYGHWGFPAEFLQYGGQADLVSGEFWFRNSLWDLGPMECRAASSAAHIYGKDQVFAEAFTAGFNFRQYPAIMKPRGDEMFCHGINHFVLHLYIHQPWEERIPGVTAWFGMSYQRHNTWFEQSKVWNEYFKRCHYLLQQGRPVSDIAYFTGEDAPKMTGTTHPGIPEGYDYDFINANIIMNNIYVKNHDLITQNGKKYRLLVLPPLETMRPELLEKLHDLVDQGARIYGPPPLRSPSMKNYPDADSKVKSIAKKLWSTSAEGYLKEKGAITETTGEGKVFYGQDLSQVLTSLEIAPDLVCFDSTVMWTHRRIISKDAVTDIEAGMDLDADLDADSDADADRKSVANINTGKESDADIYFISNQEDKKKSITLSFRITGKAPELWYPESGKIIKTAWFEQKNSRTSVQVPLDPYGSVFVMFKNPAGMPSVTRLRINGTEPEPETGLFGKGGSLPEMFYTDEGILTLKTSLPGDYSITFSDQTSQDFRVNDLPGTLPIEGPWQLNFPAGWDVPQDTTLNRLTSWTDHEHPGIRHFSGTVSYTHKINIADAMLRDDLDLILELGDVMVIAEVILNGNAVGTCWSKPFEIDITGMVKAGENELEVRVSNTWWNRLVGDEKYKEGFPGSLLDQPRTYVTHKSWTADDELMPSGLLGPVRIRIEKKIQLP